MEVVFGIHTGVAMFRNFLPFNRTTISDFWARIILLLLPECSRIWINFRTIKGAGPQNATESKGATPPRLASIQSKRWQCWS